LEHILCHLLDLDLGDTADLRSARSRPPRNRLDIVGGSCAFHPRTAVGALARVYYLGLVATARPVEIKDYNKCVVDGESREIDPAPRYRTTRRNVKSVATAECKFDRSCLGICRLGANDTITSHADAIAVLIAAKAAASSRSCRPSSRASSNPF